MAGKQREEVKPGQYDDPVSIMAYSSISRINDYELRSSMMRLANALNEQEFKNGARTKEELNLAIVENSLNVINATSTWGIKPDELGVISGISFPRGYSGGKCSWCIIVCLYDSLVKIVVNDDGTNATVSSVRYYGNVHIEQIIREENGQTGA